MYLATLFILFFVGCKTSVPQNVTIISNETTLSNQSETPTLNETQPINDSPINLPNSTICYQDSDCVIKDIGNCCGAYPRCTTKQFIPTPVNCDGMASVCGFPVIEECKCIENACESWQEGHKV